MKYIPNEKFQKMLEEEGTFPRKVFPELKRAYIFNKWYRQTKNGFWIFEKYVEDTITVLPIKDVN